MNSHITDNESSTRSVFTIEEFLKGISCLIGAACASQKGHKLFNTSPPTAFNTVTVSGREFPTIEQVPNFRQKMSLTRWKSFKHFLPLIWNDESRKHTDAWWRIRPLIELFNSNRRNLIMPTNVLVYDESIIGFAPQISPTGNLPHLSYIPEKPVSLGPEFKVLMCSSTGCHLGIELMEGKLAMAVKQYHKEFGATAALVIRMHEAW